MDRQKNIKDKSIKINKMDTNNIMDIEEFFKTIEVQTKLSIYRHINVILNTKGNKIPFGE